jgi:WD40 repeat protein
VTVTELERFRIGHDGKVTGVVFSPNGRLLATASEDHTARISALP